MPDRVASALPTISVPLRPTDADAELDLQALVDRAYRVGRHVVDIDYTAGLTPPLGNGDARWTDEMLREAGKRAARG